MSGTSRVVVFDTLRSIAFGSISGAFAAVGAEFDHVIRLIKFVNTTDADMIVSLDGVANHDIVPATGFSLYDLTTNGPTDTEFVLSQGTQVYVKQVSAPTSGTFYVVCIYGKGE